MGLVPNREACDNILKTSLLLHHARRSKNPLCLLALDAEKAFDRLDWKFIVASLEQIGLPGEFIQNIMALYTAPSARIKVNGTLSSPVKISSGTRQGCPLSPYLYILAMEHQAVALRSNSSIQGVQVGNNSYKLSIFTDGLLIYVSDPKIAFPNILHELEQFGQYSNFKVNVAKSRCLNIILPIKEKETLENNFQFQWELQFLKYLGVNIAPSEEKMYEFNYLPLLNSTIIRL